MFSPIRDFINRTIAASRKRNQRGRRRIYIPEIEILENRTCPSFVLMFEQAGFGNLIVNDNGVGDQNDNLGVIAFHGSYGTFDVVDATAFSKPAIGTARAVLMDMSYAAHSETGGSLKISLTDTDFATPNNFVGFKLKSDWAGTIQGTGSETSAKQGLDQQNQPFVLTITPGLQGPFDHSDSPFASSKSKKFDGTGTFSMTENIFVTLGRGGFTSGDITSKVKGVYSALGDFVWSDLNGNGIQDTGEPGIEGVKVNLLQDGLVIGTTNTNANGLYLFNKLAPGTYQVEFEAPAGLEFTVPNQGTDKKVDSNADTATGLTGLIVLKAGQIDRTIDAGLLSPVVLAALGDFVWKDLDADGIQDPGEPGVANVTVNLLQNGQVVDTTQTDSDGKYLFPDLNPGTYQVEFVAPADLTFTLRNEGNDDATDSDPNTATGLTGMITLLAGQINLTVDAGLVEVTPGIRLVKEAEVDPDPAAPFQPVTYHYTVENTGSAAISNVDLVDDNGTPDFAGDDFEPTFVDGDADGDDKLDADETWTYTATVIPPVTVCDEDGVIGTLIVQVLNSGDIHAVYIQSPNLNDNSYGVNQVGWVSKDHKFNDLLGSDKAQFQFTNGAGAVVLDFKLDYMSADSSVASGYRTLGISGGDGGLNTGNAAHLLSFNTSLSSNFNDIGLGVVNGVASNGFDLKLTSPQTVSSSSYEVVDPFFEDWDFRNVYEVVVSSAAFGASGFGGVEIPFVHNSPGKRSTGTPEPCDSTVTNTAVVTGTFDGQVLTASATATVQIGEGAGHGGVTAGALTVKDRQVKVAITNDGSTAIDLDQILISWPAANGQLTKIKVGGDVIFDTDTAPPSATISSFLGDLSKRTWNAGETQTITFEFEHNASTTVAAYDITLDFGNGVVVNI